MAPAPAAPTAADRLAALETGHGHLLDEVRGLRALVEERFSPTPPVDLEATVRRPLAGLDERLVGVTKALAEVRQHAEARVSALLHEVQSLKSALPKEQAPAGVSAKDVDGALGTLRSAVGKLVEDRSDAVTKLLGDVRAEASARQAALLDELRALKTGLPGKAVAATGGLSPKDVETALTTLRTAVTKVVDERLASVAKDIGAVRDRVESAQAPLLDELKALKATVQKPPVSAGLSAKDLDAALGALRTAVDKAVEDRAATLRKELAETRRLAEERQGSVLEAVRGLQAKVDQMLAPAALDNELEASVISLRRLLSELVEQRMESVMKALADARAATVGGDGGQQQVLERLDQVLQSLGALAFVAEPMDIVDPVIHTVVEERSTNGVPAGLVVATLRPGYRTARGRVLSKAAIAVSRS